MKELKLGDKVEISKYGRVQGVDIVAEITKGGNIRLSRKSDIYNKYGSLRGAGKWDTTHIRKITEEEYNNYLNTQRLKQKCNRIIEELGSIKDVDLISYGTKIASIYDSLFED